MHCRIKYVDMKQPSEGGCFQMLLNCDITVDKRHWHFRTTSGDDFQTVLPGRCGA